MKDLRDLKDLTIRDVQPIMSERRGNNLIYSQDFRTENGASQGQGQNLALTCLLIPTSLDSGRCHSRIQGLGCEV